MDNLFSQLEIRIIRSGKNKSNKTVLKDFNRIKEYVQENTTLNCCYSF